jgi:hypothetical protein
MINCYCIRVSINCLGVFPPNYNIYRRDRRDGFGGVLVAVKADIMSDHLDVEINTESVYTSITLEKGKCASFGDEQASGGAN